MVAFLSLDFLKSLVEIFFICVSYLKGVLLPDQNGTSAFFPEVNEQLTTLNAQRSLCDSDFPRSCSPLRDADRGKWMMEILQDCTIGQILWPGTHHSATSQIGFPYITRPFAQRQTMSILDQLLKGVRAFDIRIQQDHLVCNGRILSDTTIDHVIKEITTFLKETMYEIVILEIRTERGYLDPAKFEEHLVTQLGKLLIHQDENVFSKTISEVLPGRIICIWKPIINASKTKPGEPIWSGKYIKTDEIDIELPRTRIKGNIKNLKRRSKALSINKYFYKVEHTLNPQTNTRLGSLMVWPKHAAIVSRRINGYARLFLAKCHKKEILPRLQIFSVDFVTDDFISACIEANLHMIKSRSSSNGKIIASEEPRPLETTSEDSSNVNMTDNSSSSNDMINGTRDSTAIENDNTHMSMTREKIISVWRRPSTLNIALRGNPEKWVTRCWGSDFKAAYFLKVYSLNLSGDYELDNLQQGTRYEVLFWVKMLDSPFGWESQIHLQLILPDGSTQENHPILDMTPRKSLYIPAGNFVMSPEMMMRQIKYSLQQPETDVPKGGIAIFGVLIQPCFINIVTTSDLSIMFRDVGECWRVKTVPSRYAKRDIEVAEMISVDNFKVDGVFETRKLLDGQTYNVGFQVMLSSTSTGWESPTEMTLRLPNGVTHRTRDCFKDMPKDEDVRVYVGEFKMSADLHGKRLEISMENDDNEIPKSGISIMLAFIEEQH